MRGHRPSDMKAKGGNRNIIASLLVVVVVVRPFLNASKRELLADCALPVAVLLMSFFGSYVFRDVKREYIRTIELSNISNCPLH